VYLAARLAHDTHMDRRTETRECSANAFVSCNGYHSVLTNSSNPIRHISDTALWVAVYRARESERADAVFRDPYASKLGGDRGMQMAAAMPFAQKHSWSYVARTWLVDQVIERELPCGTDMVINLAAGLDARPYRMRLPASLRRGIATQLTAITRDPRAAKGLLRHSSVNTTTLAHYIKDVPEVTANGMAQVEQLLSKLDGEQVVQ
jgi:hypothetical protein